MVTDSPRWVLDTSVYTHFFRAGHGNIIRELAPSATIVIPTDVINEITAGREKYSDIPAVSTLEWADIAVLTEAEEWTQLQIKGQMGGHTYEHLGECAVIACAYHRGMVAVLDDQAAVAQAEVLGVPVLGTMWIVVEAYKSHFGRDRERTAQMYDDLRGTGMYLPIQSGESVLGWAYEAGLLP
jgi:predicted nucleic acid-binding protein